MSSINNSDKLWVKIEGGSATRVSTNTCEYVDDYIEALKKKLEMETSIALVLCN